MSYKVNDAAANPALNALATAISGGFMYLYAGTVPAGPDAALDMGAVHTELVVISVDGDGVTGLTFATAASGAVAKPALAVWTGTAAFVGFGAAETELTPTFFRICASGDNGRGAGATPRLQGTIGVTGSGADLERASPLIEVGSTVPVTTFEIQVGSVG